MSRQGTCLICQETFHLVDFQEMHTNSWHSCSRNYIRRFLANVNIVDLLKMKFCNFNFLTHFWKNLFEIRSLHSSPTEFLS